MCCIRVAIFCTSRPERSQADSIKCVSSSSLAAEGQLVRHSMKTVRRAGAEEHASRPPPEQGPPATQALLLQAAMGADAALRGAQVLQQVCALTASVLNNVPC